MIADERVIPLKKLICMTACCALLFAGCNAHEHKYTDTVVPPTCTEMGYTVHSCGCGETYFSDYRTTATHSFGDWIAGVTATLTEGGEEYRLCKTCGYLQTRNTQNASVLPKVYLSSEGSVFYSHGELHFTCDSNSLVGEGKPEIQLLFTKNGSLFPVDLGWGEQSAYRLDPCTPDLTYARASAAEALWDACTKLREDASEAPVSRLYPVGGGYLVQVYHDDDYLGIYRLTPPMGGWAYAASQGGPAAVFRGSKHSAECLFLTSPVYDEEGFALQYCSTENGEWAKESFEAFINFVRKSSDGDFKEKLSEYTDLTALMDHFLLTVLFGSGNGDTEGTLWSTADGVHWLPSFSPLHTAYGLTEDGKQTSAALGIPIPVENTSVAYEGDNLLWQRLCNVFGEELRVRYTRLRATALHSPTALYRSVLQQQAAAEAELLEMEKNLLPSLSQNAVKVETLKDYIQDRLAAMDAWLGAFE